MAFRRHEPTFSSGDKPLSARRYLVLDVFTRTKLAGNPLAVVLDADGLDTAAMQKIANEFNLSETVFVLPPADPRHRARIRIFTPHYELPFAGHPTVGAAVALGEAGDAISRIIVLEENVGPVRCAVSVLDGVSFAEFDSPKPAEALPLPATRETIAAALGLDASDIGFEGHEPGCWSAGVPYVTVPVSGLDALARARLDPAPWMDITGFARGTNAPAAYIYCRKPSGSRSAFRARMLAGHLGLVEDPATGSAAAAFAGAVFRFDAPSDGAHRVAIEQGVEMGRPSEIRLEIDVKGGAMTGARIGGCAVRIAEGTLIL